MQQAGLDDLELQRFFGQLKRAGYRRRFSGECGLVGEPVAAMRLSADFLRRAWARA